MSSSTSITLYDIASAPPLRTFAANPWKARFALNYKRLPYRTEWIQMPDITSVQEKLGVPANRTLPDGTPYHTLPVVHDESKNELIGDSFEIAQYLDKTYPDAPKLFDANTTGLTAAFNAYVDGTFTKFAILCTAMPFDPSVAAKVGEIFAKRAAIMDVSMQPSAEQHEQKLKEFEAALGELAKAYRHTGGTTDYFWRQGGTDKEQGQRGREQVGPWLEGEEPKYADFIVGAWLKMFEASMPEGEWKMVREWQDGLWGRVVDALKPWSEIK